MIKGLVHHWSTDRTESFLEDQISGNHYILGSGSFFTDDPDGIEGRVVKFSGANATSLYPIYPTTEFSISVRYRLNDYLTELWLDNTSAPFFRFGVGLTILFLETGGSPYTSFPTLSPICPLFEWHTFGVSYSANIGTSLYLDGNLIHNLPYNGTPYIPSTTVAKTSALGGYFKEMRFYNTFLSPQEHQVVAQNPHFINLTYTTILDNPLDDEPLNTFSDDPRLKRIDQNPRITDTILFEITTPTPDGCLLEDPYKIEKVVIYYIERDFVGNNYGEYTRKVYNKETLAKFEELQKLTCENPTDENFAKLNELKSELEQTAQSVLNFFTEAKAVKIFGSEENPAWLSTDQSNAILTHINIDREGNPLFGTFSLEWTPESNMREGDYFICWSWMQNVSSSFMSAHLPFSLVGDPRTVITIPSHITKKDKYITLLERYLPDMYKNKLLDGDLTPEMTQKLNEIVAFGFTLIEDLANQLIDLFDANALHEALLTYLSNLFNLRLKSQDPTLWRRQIKNAVPNFKKKGTFGGLVDAFADAGIVLQKYTQYWQLLSSYTWTDGFRVINPADSLSTGGVSSLSVQVVNNLVFKLSKLILLPTSPDYFKLLLKRFDEPDNFIEIPQEMVGFEIDTETMTAYMYWKGDQGSANTLDLFVGDILVVSYPYKRVPNNAEKALNEYLLSLPLQDQRDVDVCWLPNNFVKTVTLSLSNSPMNVINAVETPFDDTVFYPPKDFNTRLLPEDDPLFNVLVPVRHPFYDPVIFGYVRTEFPYSENAYNTEEYNGSTRPSTSPCDIDREFLNPCSACLSSNFSIDVEIDTIGNDRLVEVSDIIDEYTPFHSRLFMVNYSGSLTDFIPIPEERIEILITYRQEDFLVMNANPVFNRAMRVYHPYVLRGDLAEMNLIHSNNATAYNTAISLYSPEVFLDSLGIIPTNILKILSPSPNAGSYVMSNIEQKTADVAGVIEPLNPSSFIFDIYNELYSTSGATILQDNKYTLLDDFNSISVISQFDIDNHPELGVNPYRVLISAYSLTPYVISHVLPDGSLLLVDNGTLPSASAVVSYEVLDGDNNSILTGSGNLNVELRGRVNINDSEYPLITQDNFLKFDDILVYLGIEYNIVEFNGAEFFITGYGLGNAFGVSVDLIRYLAINKLGYFRYRGLKLLTIVDEEASLGILNGANAPLDENLITDNNLFKENFLIKIIDDFFKIEEIDGLDITLGGLNQDWFTFVGGGTWVTYDVYHLPKKPVTIRGETFVDGIDRGGIDDISVEIETASPLYMSMLSSGSGAVDVVGQEESIEVIIETKDGVRTKEKL